MWKFNNIRLFVTEMVDKSESIIASIQPLNGGTVYHTFGYIHPILSLEGYIVGNTDKEALRNAVESRTPYSLVSDQGTVGNFIAKSVTFSRTPSICQTIRTDLDKSSPVYKFSLELLANV